ncbi:protein HipA [Solemya pervernicosa gill symbiont]|uniref:Protein HipA n=1 Tax=Solemya pervernicosa gill symbiont TaxID=642797 RepID=A0A1T2KZ78_9GAMM|nr:type II toxin-antitoxin system HipA family toxin [Solemya pervernicosa gill symbiont]OOZ38131.1 protein HipA [Solemya pervernicosa gill symbiont]
MNQPLNVFLRDQRVGTLWLDEGRRFLFQYTEAWLMKANSVPLSIHLQLQPEAFNDAQARPFFANLLPESEVRRAIARRLGLSEQNDFALLEAVGGECAGAVSLLSDDKLPDGHPDYRRLGDDELNQLIDDLHNRPMLAGEVGIRLSLAGAQNKLPVFFDSEAVHLPMGGAASSHILKPPIERVAHSVENETFCMQLARTVGLNVPESQILQHAKSLYLVNRYDREVNAAGNLFRIHQEDFCQALGVPPDTKYEAEGGPSLAQCFDLVRDQSIQPAADIASLLDWVIFNVLVGNADAHAKNISLLLTDSGPQLAPFYDLMCTAIYPDLAERMAMKIGGENRPEWIIERKWQAFAEEVGIKYRLIEKKLKEFSESLPELAAQTAQVLGDQYGDCVIYNEIQDLIKSRCTKTQRFFN